MGILDKVIDKTKELKSEYDQRKRAEKEDWINVKEENLSAKEKTLNERDLELQQLARALATKEKYLLNKERRPLYVFLICLVGAGFAFGYLVQNFEFTKRIHPVTKAETAIENKQANKSEASDVADSSSSSRLPELTERDRNIHQSYNGLEMGHRDFDVGRYCLNEEKKGVMTFEQCLGLAVAKAAGSR